MGRIARSAYPQGISMAQLWPFYPCTTRHPQRVMKQPCRYQPSWDWFLRLTLCAFVGILATLELHSVIILSICSDFFFVRILFSWFYPFIFADDVFLLLSVINRHLWKTGVSPSCLNCINGVPTAVQGGVSECYSSLTAHQHQKGHTVPNQV